MSVFVICACEPERVRLYVRPPGDDDYELVGDLAHSGPVNPCALAAGGERMATELGWDRSKAGLHTDRADDLEMRARVDSIMEVLTSTPDPLTAREVAERSNLPPSRRSDVYRQLNQLIEQGLVARTDTRPYRYRPSKLREDA